MPETPYDGMTAEEIAAFAAGRPDPAAPETAEAGEIPSIEKVYAELLYLKARYERLVFENFNHECKY